MCETGLVIKVDGPDVELEVTPGVHCQSCARKDGCHARLDLGLTEQEPTLRARNDAGAEVGDRVEVEIPGRTRVAAMIAAFGVPAVLAVAGAVIGSLRGSDVGTGIGLAIGLALGICIGMLLNWALGGRADMEPRVARITRRAPEKAWD